jgi:hypothetical protein
VLFPCVLGLRYSYTSFHVHTNRNHRLQKNKYSFFCF